MKKWMVGGVEMDYPIMVGAGVCKAPESVLPYEDPNLPIGACESGSYTPDDSKGNTGGSLSAWISDLNSGLNAYGMPNCGQEEADRRFSNMVLKRPLIFNAAAFEPEGFKKAYLRFSKRRYVSAINFNKSCPNKGKTPPSFDLIAMRESLTSLRTVSAQMPLWIKLSPYLTKEDVNRLSAFVDVSNVITVAEDFVHDVVLLLNQFVGLVSAVVGTNTIGNCRYLQDGKPVTSPFEGKAGLSGTLLREISLRQVERMRNMLHPSIDVIGQGGVLHGDHGLEYLKRGAAAFACTSLPYWFGGPKVFPQLIAESEGLQNFLSTHL